jgi:hypothetical protein
MATRCNLSSHKPEDERQILEEFAHALEQGNPNVDRLVE